MDVLSAVIGFVLSVPVVGPILVKVLTVVLGLSAVVSAVFGVWLGAVKVLDGLAKIPGLGKLQATADKLRVVEGDAEGFFATKVLPVLNRLSLIPLPKAKE